MVLCVFSETKAFPWTFESVWLDFSNDFQLNLNLDPNCYELVDWFKNQIFSINILVFAMIKLINSHDLLLVLIGLQTIN